MAAAAATPYSTPTNPTGTGVNIDDSGIYTPGYVPTSGPAITALQNYGLSNTPSPWAMAALASQSLTRQNQASNDAQAAAGQTQQAEDALAMQGGLSSGARERAVEGGAKNYLSMVQGGEQQENQNDLQIAENDAQNKLQNLNTSAQLESTNTANENSYNANLYNQQMSAWAAQQQAAATENAGKK